MIEVHNDRGTGRQQPISVPKQNDYKSIPTGMTASTTSIKSSNLGLPPNGHRPRSGSAREQTLHAVEYYNNNVLKARVGAGLCSIRNSVNERHFTNNSRVTNESNKTRVYLSPEHLYRSNSSLELLHDHNTGNNDVSNLTNGNLKREYGSHGSIDVISSPNGTTSESFFALLQDYRPAVLGVIGTDQRSPGPAEFLKGKLIQNSITVNGDKSLSQSNDGSIHQNQERQLSPKLRNKLQRIWGPNGINYKNNTSIRPQTATIDECSILNTSFQSSITGSMCNTTTNSLTSHNVSMSSADIEERQRRRAFAHYDCQSLTANLGYAAKLRGLLLARRRNTATGASAASMMNTTPDTDITDEDLGDGQSNDLLENCPFFRNEIGNEEIREVSLTRIHISTKPNKLQRAIHRPILAYGISVLECPSNEILWKQTTCPYQKGPRPIESVDHGALYYRKYFHGEEHQNWFGMDEQLGPIAISIKREKLIDTNNENNTSRYQFRLIIRTSELLTLRGSIIEDSIPNQRGSGKPATTKEVLEYVAPEIQLNCLRLGINTQQCEQQLIKLDEQGLTNKYKVGILYCRAGQSSEEDMYNNEEAGPAFIEFLDTIGRRVRLKGFENYKAGLDNKTDSTGTHSLHTKYQDCEIMFHVSTMLPFTPNNRQQLLRKRHIGNDIVTIVFQEPGALPFTPKNIRSQFQHVFIIVRAVNPCSPNAAYRIAVSRSKEVPVFGPPIPAGGKFPRGKAFAEFLLSKLINAENAAHRSEKFATMATRTRQEYLKDLTTNYCSSTVVDPGTKFSIFPSKKKEKLKPRFSGDAIQRGAFCWQVVLQDSGLSSAVDCFLGISTETFVLIEECTRQIIFVTPTKSILGWSTNGNSLRIYHHQGECITLNMRDSGERDEQLEVIERLRSVTIGCGALELNLRRNPMGQLGFHVQPDGVVTQVETSGQAWIAGLRQGYRLVEICKIAVATLLHDQMVDLLKTSAQVTVTVIESFPDFTPRRGCFLQNCKFNMIMYENEYDTTEAGKNTKKLSNAQLQQPGQNHRRCYERNFSPPRSSNSSGYGTGSSSRSFTNNDMVRQPTDTGTLTSSSSGHSSNDDRWYFDDLLENIVDLQQSNNNRTNRNIKHNHNNSEHPKLTTSNSLPIVTNNPRPLSVHDPTKIIGSKNEVSNRSNSRFVNPNQNSKNIEPEKYFQSLTIATDGLISDSRELIYNKNTSTDDEIYDNSPRLKRSATASNLQKVKTNNGIVSSSSNSSSRNNSPRPSSELISAVAAAKLRPGITSRNQAYFLQRNSVNYAGSSLQEDLMKLINPDYIMTADDSIVNTNGIKNQKNLANSHSLGNISILSGGFKIAAQNDEFLLKKKSRSREAINFGQQPVPELKMTTNSNSNDNQKTEVIFTTARPATIISQSNSNLSENNQISDDNILHISEGNLKTSTTKPNNNNNNNNNNHKKYNPSIISQPLPLLTDTSDMDWSSLVDTATRAMMMQFQEDERRKSIALDSLITDDYQEQHQNSIESNKSNLPELQNQLSQLEDRILRETRRRKSLEHAVRRLTEENRRLQDESQAAVQQLRRFTEWFFQTIDRQS